MRVAPRFITLQRRIDLQRGLVAAVLTSSLVGQCFWSKPAQAQVTAFCQLSTEAIAQKETLRQAALKGDKDAQGRYQALLKQHAEVQQKCRSQAWPRNQAIWLRLYPCDTRPGALDDIMDRLVNRGYNRVYVEVFYNGQVLLPSADNKTAWPSVVRAPGSERVDLLAQAIQKGQERGLKVYAWMFSLNFGYSYAQRPDRQHVLARNGRGQTSLGAIAEANPGGVSSEEAFVDPYHPQAKRDYYQLLQAVVQRKPDGVLFDYIRYPKGSGGASVASRVQDLWIYGDAAQQALYQRATNNKGLALMRRFVSKGYITAGDITELDKLYPGEAEPLWQGRTPPASPTKLTAIQRQPLLQQELWLLSVAHAFQGVYDFLATMVPLVQQQGMAAGVVFFPDGNQIIGQGFDSRLQLWERFPSNIEWHPMSYGLCSEPSCIVSLVQRVTSQAPAGTSVEPVIAGTWGGSISGRPPLEAQMQGIRQAAPQVNTISHFAFSWQEPEVDRDRKFCRL